MSDSPRPRGRGIVIVAVVVVAAVAGVLIERALRDDAPLTVAAAPDARAAPAPDASADVSPPEAPPAKVVPETLPQIEVPDLENKPRRLGEWAGRPLIVNYWATWCAPCVREIPLLNQIRREHASSRLEIIGIAVDFRDEVLAFTKTTPMDYPVLVGDVDSPQVVAAVGMDPTLPFTVFADSQQRIVALKIGELHHDEAELILSRIARVDAGEMELPTARQEISEGLKELAARRAGATG